MSYPKSPGGTLVGITLGCCFALIILFECHAARPNAIPKQPPEDIPVSPRYLVAPGSLTSVAVVPVPGGCLYYTDRAMTWSGFSCPK